MPSSPTPLLNVEQQAAGENLNVWGDPNLNAALQRLTEAIAATTSVSTYPITLTSTNYVANQARNMILSCTGVGGTVTIPGQSKLYIVRNASSGNVVITAGGVTATVASGDTVPVICDGVDCRLVSRTDFQNAVLKNVANGSSALDGVNRQQLDATLAAAQAYTDATAFASASLPGQAGNAGKFLTTDGSNTAWAQVFPAFVGTTDYILTSTGAASAWSSPASVRTKLSLGGAALLNVGTTAGTVAAGNDSRIVGAAQLSGAVFVGAISGPSGVFTALSGALTGSLIGNASTSTTLATARDLSLTGDATATLSSFNGGANVSGALTLANSGVTAGTYGNLTIDAKGRVTAASAAPYLRAAGLFTGSTGAAVGTPLNMSCIRSSPSVFAFTFTSALPNANYILHITPTPAGSNGLYQCNVTSKTASGFSIQVLANIGGSLGGEDPAQINVTVFA